MIAALCLGLPACAAGFGGTWSGTVSIKPKKKEAAKTSTATLSLKEDGTKLTGTMSLGRGKRKSVEIKEGTVDGNQISFTTTAKTKKKGEVTRSWEGTLSGDELKIMSHGGKKRSSTIVLKRQG